MILIGGLLATFAASFVYLYTLWAAIGNIPGLTGPPVDWMNPLYSDALQLSRTATFITMVLFQLLWVWNCRDDRNPVWRTDITGSRILLLSVGFSFLLTLLALYTPLSVAVGTVPLGIDTWVLILAASLVGLLTPVYRLLPHEPSEEHVENVL